MSRPECGQNPNTRTVYGKLAAIKISNVLYSNKYCCICLETCDGLLGLDTCDAVDGGEQNLLILTLREMLEAIFDDTVLHILRDSSEHMCPACLESIKKTLSFIQRTKTHALIFERYFTTLNRLTNNLFQLSDIEYLSPVVLNASLVIPSDENARDMQGGEGSGKGERGVKRKKSESPQVCKRAKVADSKEKDKPVETEVDIERRESENGSVVKVIAESNESGNEFSLTEALASPDNSGKDSQQFSSTSEPTHVAKVCCPVCDKRPCRHENYLVAFEKQRNRIIECPECNDFLHTLSNLIKHVEMGHFKNKPSIQDVCNKMFVRDSVNKDDATKNLSTVCQESQESENSEQFLDEVGNGEPPISAEVIVQELSNKGYKILRLERQESETSVLHPATPFVKDTCSTGTELQKKIDKKIDVRDAEQIIDETVRNLSDEQHSEKIPTEQKTDINSDSKQMQCDTGNKFVQSNVVKNLNIFCLKPDVTAISNVHKKVLTSILKKNGNSSKKERKSVKFGDCPTLSEWRKANFSANTELHAKSKSSAEIKTTKKVKENEEFLSTNVEQDVDTIEKGIEKFHSKRLTRLDKTRNVNKTTPRELRVVLVDVLKNRKPANLQPQTFVNDEKYKIPMTNIKNDEIRRLGSEQLRVKSTRNSVVTVQKKVSADVSKENDHNPKPQEPLKPTLDSLNVDVASNKKNITIQHKIVNEQTKSEIKKKASVKILSNEIIVYPELQKSIKSTVITPKVVSTNQKDSINIPNVVQTNIDLKNSQKMVDKPKKQLTCKERREKYTVKPSDTVLNLEAQSPTSKKDSKQAKNNELKTAQEILVNAEEQTQCKKKIDENIVRPNDGKVFDLEIKSPIKGDKKNNELTNIELKNAQEVVEMRGKNTKKFNDENVFNLEQKSFFGTHSRPQKPSTSPKKKEFTNKQSVHEQTGIELKTAQEIVDKNNELSTSKEKEEKPPLRLNDAKVSNLNRKLVARINNRKKLAIGKKTILGNLRKKKGTRLSQIPQKNLTKRVSSLTVTEKLNILEESDEIIVETEEPSIVEIIEEAEIVEKNEKQLLAYEKQRRNRTFECPECKKTLYSLKYLIAHVNKNHSMNNSVGLDSNDSQNVSLKDDTIQSLKPVVKTPKLLVASKPLSAVHTAFKSVPLIKNYDAGKVVRSENDSSIFHKPTTSEDQKNVHKENKVKCSQCNIFACRHEKYKQVYEKLQKNKIFKCPECKYMIYSLSDFIDHVSKYHPEYKIILRDVYNDEFPNTFVKTGKETETLKNDCSPAKKKVPGESELVMNTKCSITSDTVTPMELEVEFSQDMEELDKDAKGRGVDRKNKDKTLGDKSNKPVKCHECQFVCPNEQVYEQHRQEHELQETIHKEVTAQVELEGMEVETEIVKSEGNNRSHTCGTCGAICKSRNQLTLHLKSTGHLLLGTTPCPLCLKRPCRHEKYLCAYEKQTAKEKIACCECTKNLLSLSSLISHVNKEHLNIKSIKCDECHKMVRSDLFKEHSKNCQKQPSPVKCAESPALFVNEKGSMLHNLKNLELGEVIRKTEDPKNTLKKPENLEISDEKKTYNECGTCGEVFKHKSWLKLHLKVNHHVVK